MPRLVSDHQVPQVPTFNDLVRVEAIEEQDGSPPGKYLLYLRVRGEWTRFSEIKFQKGPLSEQLANGQTREVPPNGIGSAALLALLIDHFRAFQETPMKCRENAIVLTHLEEALMWLQKRALERVVRDVEGTQKP